MYGRIGLLVITGLLASCVVDGQGALRVVSVADGDTLTVADSLQQQTRVRLAYIDAPEKSQAFGQQAKKKLISLCAQSQNVHVEQVDKDQYGRVVGVVQCDGVNANAEMVKAGLAWVYRRYAPQGSPLYQYEAEAKRSRLGLWQEKRPTPPWEYRRKHRS